MNNGIFQGAVLLVDVDRLRWIKSPLDIEFHRCRHPILRYNVHWIGPVFFGSLVYRIGHSDKGPFSGRERNHFIPKGRNQVKPRIEGAYWFSLTDQDTHPAGIDRNVGGVHGRSRKKNDEGQKASNDESRPHHLILSISR